MMLFFFSSRRRHTSYIGDWSSDVCSSDLVHSHASLKLTRRLRRLRQSPEMRALVRETRLSPDMFVLPLFVCEGEGVRQIGERRVGKEGGCGGQAWRY